MTNDDNRAPDADCITTPDGDCTADNCMHRNGGRLRTGRTTSLKYTPAEQREYVINSLRDRAKVLVGAPVDKETMALMEKVLADGLKEIYRRDLLDYPVPGARLGTFSIEVKLPEPNVPNAAGDAFTSEALASMRKQWENFCKAGGPACACVFCEAVNVKANAMKFDVQTESRLGEADLKSDMLDEKYGDHYVTLTESDKIDLDALDRRFFEIDLGHLKEQAQRLDVERTDQFHALVREAVDLIGLTALDAAIEVGRGTLLRYARGQAAPRMGMMRIVVREIIKVIDAGPKPRTDEDRALEVELSKPPTGNPFRGM